jgi:hypothetical protein
MNLLSNLDPDRLGRLDELALWLISESNEPGRDDELLEQDNSAAISLDLLTKCKILWKYTYKNWITSLTIYSYFLIVLIYLHLKIVLLVCLYVINYWCLTNTCRTPILTYWCLTNTCRTPILTNQTIFVYYKRIHILFLLSNEFKILK